MDVFRSPAPVEWRFPTVNTHDGLPLGNGLFGALLWGSDNVLRLTLNRSDYWSHEDGFLPGEQATYANLRAWLEAGDEASVRRVFEGRDEQGAIPPRPTRLPLGRIDLEFPERLRLESGSLDVASGSAGIAVQGPSRVSVEAVMPRQGALLALRMQGCCFSQVKPVPVPASSPAVQAYYAAQSFSPPDERVGTVLSGWTQRRPHDLPVAVACLLDGDTVGYVTLYIAVEYGASSNDAWRQAEAAVQAARERGYDALADEEAAWWRSFWSRCARIQLDSPVYQALYNLGMYRLACASMPGGPAMGLQGPWIEDDRLAPWQGDYHFNINVQMCHWPALAGNWPAAMEPLWRLVHGWLPTLRDNARRYVGIDDGYLLPHAVDDRAVAMGGFWAGHVDHGCTAWLALLAWRYYRFTLDEAVLREVAYPLLRGALRVYDAMLEEAPDGRLALPVGVSAEWGGHDLHAWGRNASYQLALLHTLARELPKAAQALGQDEPLAARCADIAARLPLFASYTVQGQAVSWGADNGDGVEIAVWEGLAPLTSHRHFSHLIGLYPLDLFDLRRDRKLSEVVARSLERLTRAGKGEWCGWSFPWAALLLARLGMGNAAALNLEAFRRAFVTPNGAPLIFPRLEGLAATGPDTATMQLDGGMGLTTALQEMLVHTSCGVLHVFPAVPDDWRQVRLLRARAEGGFVVSAEREDGATRWVRILATADAELRLALPFSDSRVGMISSREPQPSTWIGAGIIRRHMRAGEEITLTPSARLEQQ
jgi:hypothetical protein